MYGDSRCQPRSCRWILTLLLLNALPMWGATLTVQNTNDSGPGSLRQVILTANAGDTINFTVTGTITLLSALPAITANLTITGPGASVLAISGNNAVPVFTISPGAVVSLSGVTILNGLSNSSGGGISNSGTLTLSNSTLSGNSASGSGGGIFNSGTLMLSNSTLSGNSAASAGGGIFTSGTLTLSGSTLSGNTAGGGGGIYNSGGQMALSNSTLSGNSAAFAGGGISNELGGQTTLSNSTLSGNSSAGGGIFNFGTLTIKNTLLAHGSSGANCSSAGFISGGHNISDDNSCSFGGIGDLNNTPAGTAGLANNGGPTQTIALLPGSPAIDAIPLSPVNYCTATDGITPIGTDQRGITRPQGPNCDIGAFELVEGPFSTTTTAAAVTATFSPNSQNVTLSATVTSGAGTVNSGTVTFTVLGSSVTSGTVSNGAASATFVLPGNTPAGPYTITATYNPGGGFVTSSDSTHTLTVNGATAIPVMSPAALAAFALLLAGLGWIRARKAGAA